MKKPQETMEVPCSGCGLPHTVEKTTYLSVRKWGKRPNYHVECMRAKNRTIPVGKRGESKGLAWKGEYSR